MRGLAYKIHHKKRIIAKRLQIVTGWGIRAMADKPSRYELEPGRLAKYNLNCGCKMCHYYKHDGNKGKGKQICLEE